MNPEQLSPPLSRLQQCLIWRLLPARKPVAKSDLDKALRRYFADRVAMPAAQWREELERAVARLREAGLVDASTLHLTEQGRAQALRLLGVDALSPQASWATVRNRHLMAVALGIQPRTKAEWDRLGTAEGLRAAILARHYRLPLGPVPTPSRVLHALAWLQLQVAHAVDLPLDKDFSRKAVLSLTLLRGSASKNPEAMLAAEVTGAVGTQLEKVREAVLCNWVAAETAPPSLSPAPLSLPSTASPPSPSSPLPSRSPSPSTPSRLDGFDLAAFAAQVLALARSAVAGRFGDHKVFIAHVWEGFRQQPEAAALTRAEFDAHLVEANRQGLLRLSRADLVSGMDPDDVQRSEIRLPYSSFHFVRTDHVPQ